jgi:restriction endonuclease S subunit
MSYTISKSLNPKRVFILQKSELEKRFDPFFYIPELLELEKKIKAKKFNKLSQICEPFKNGSTPKEGNFSKSGVLYYRSQDFDLFELKETQYITEEFNSQIKRSEVKVNDIMLAVVGATLGKIGFINDEKKEGNINQNVARIRLSSNEYLPKFLALFLSTEMGQKQIKRNATITTQAYLNNEVLGNILIPYVSIKEQEKVIETFNKTTLQKQTNEAEAEKLLASINDYLLGQLGITLPTPPENTLKNRMFVASFKSIESRLDPHFYLTYYIALENAIKNSPNKVFRLDEIFEINRGGSPRPIHNFMTEDENGVNWIKIGDTKNDNKYIYQTADKIIPEGAKYSRKVEVGDFILSNSMSFGRPYIMKIEGYIHDGWLLFKPKFDEFNADYFHSILSSQLMYKLFKKATIGGVVENLNIELVKKISIPVPPLDKQKEIAEHITDIRNQAQALKDKTKDLLKKASEEIEMILLN